jgi:hypothetical protein
VYPLDLPIARMGQFNYEALSIHASPQRHSDWLESGDEKNPARSVRLEIVVINEFSG